MRKLPAEFQSRAIRPRPRDQRATLRPDLSVRPRVLFAARRLKAGDKEALLCSRVKTFIIRHIDLGIACRKLGDCRLPEAGASTYGASDCKASGLAKRAGSALAQRLRSHNHGLRSKVFVRERRLSGSESPTCWSPKTALGPLRQLLERHARSLCATGAAAAALTFFLSSSSASSSSLFLVLVVAVVMVAFAVV